MLRRTGTAAAAAAILVLVVPGHAQADPTAPTGAGAGSFLSSIECGDDGGGGCDILVRSIQSAAGSAGTAGGAAGAPALPAPDPNDPYANVDWDAIDWSAVDWSAVDWDAIDWESIDYSGGAATPATEGADPVALIVESMDSFDLPEPEISSSPAPDSLILVTTPVWLWIDEAEWQPATAEAEVPGMSLSLTAVPRATRWEMGDGTEVVCEGPGTPYDPATHAPDAESPDCGHVYTRSSLAEPDDVFTVRARISWDITWEISGGDTGTLDPVTTTSTVDLTVRESQGLVTEDGA
ncbi:hypothetical protein HNR12_004892 [Streptomonospora nanhaiensis]|uniref:ATP/GTP-binding protein n=1 Tax=Streptomonospora nanhaiensis TaxID=1323731 RepID=A0A853BV35_9ACTN|nr:hypothetical protein [Streptomonospora nanhaiensis]NYI98615.1 hypothetical protein [Streptomonospora nanhaiensis]